MAELWRHADFKRLWAAQAVSAFGSRITRTALPIIAVKTLGVSESLVGLLAALQIAPGAVLALFVGGLVDRSHKRRILIGADLFRAVVVGSLTIAWALDALSIVQVVVVGALVGAASSLFTIADVAFLPSVVHKKQLAEGNAKLESTEAVAEITGPATAGALIAVLGAPLTVLVDAATYVWSALFLSRVRTVEKPQQLDPTASVGWQTAKDLRVGLRAVFGNPHVRPIVLATMASMVCGGFFVATYALFCLRTLGLPESTFGIIVAMGGIGSLGGAMLSRPLAKKIGVGRTIIVTALLTALGGLLVPLARGDRTTVLLFLGAHQLLSDGFAVAMVIQMVTLRQTVLPKEILGRANAAIHVVTIGILPISALVAGVIAEVIGTRTAVWIGMAANFGMPLLLLPLQGLREMPASASQSLPLEAVLPAGESR